MKMIYGVLFYSGGLLPGVDEFIAIPAFLCYNHQPEVMYTMELTDIFLLYNAHPPLDYEIKDTSHGASDFRQAIMVDWGAEKRVIKITCNAFTTAHRVEGWRQTIEAYRALGYYCPRIVPSRTGSISETLEYNGRQCVVFAEEFSIYQTAEQFGRERTRKNDRYIFHDDAIRMTARAAAACLDCADYPSAWCILECFDPSEPDDEVMECALGFKKIMDEEVSRYQERFQRIWDTFLENKARLSRVYRDLPTSVFQADPNDSNILLDRDLRFMGVLDFNISGRETVLNMLFRDAFINFDEEIPEEAENNRFYVEGISERNFAIFTENLLLAKEIYPFTQAEIEAAPMLYRYLRPFWWYTLHALARDKGDLSKVDRILSWIENEQTREIDFQRILA